MGMTLAAATGATISLGFCLVVAGLVPRPQLSTGSSTSLLTTVRKWWMSLPRRRKLWIAGSAIAGVVAAFLTGWLMLLVLVPAALLIVPGLLAAPAQPEIAMLAALDRWVRLVAQSLTAGKSIRDAIFATRHQVPEALVEAVTHLVTRLDQRWTMRDALFAMADEIELADADAVLAAMSVAAARGGAGARATLNALTETLQDRLRGLREVEVERAKPRQVARQVTVITLCVLVLAMVMSPQFFAPYTTPTGSLIAAGLAAAYLGCLLMLRRMTVPAPAPRFLRRAS